MIQVDGIRKVFGAIVAVDGLTFDIKDGEIFGLLGPNGAGKTTTINMLVGQLTPDAGQIVVNGGGRPTDMSVRMRLGVAPQALALYRELTAEQNVRLFGQLYGLHGARLAERVPLVLEQTGLSDRARDAAKTYSGGMLRRLNLAIALVHNPAVLLLDEPTAGVDPQSRNAIFELILRLNAEGRTILYTTHYMEEAQRLCHRVGIVDHGRLLALDTIQGLLDKYGRASVVIVERADGEERIETEDPKAVLGRVLQEPNIVGVRVERPDLESVFLSLTGRRLRD
jgi:ABC-2 type transport system ATP-binding protein